MNYPERSERRLRETREASIPCHLPLRKHTVIKPSKGRRRRKPETTPVVAVLSSQAPPKQPAHFQPPITLLPDHHIHGALRAAAAAAAVEGPLLLPENSERREFGAGQIVGAVKDGGGGGHFGHFAAGRRLQALRGFGSDDDVGAGSGLPG